MRLSLRHYGAEHVINHTLKVEAIEVHSDLILFCQKGNIPHPYHSYLSDRKENGIVIEYIGKIWSKSGAQCSQCRH